MRAPIRATQSSTPNDTTIVRLTSFTFSRNTSARSTTRPAPTALIVARDSSKTDASPGVR